VSVWAARRFWSEVTVLPDEGGFSVELDGRPVRTPRKAPLVLPTASLAKAVAEEWQAVDIKVDPARMPFTRRANSAIDTVAPQTAAVVTMLAAYGASDLLCYRAEGPQSLVACQREAWDPLLDWSASALSAPLIATTGVMHVAQPVTSVAALADALRSLSAFQLVAFHDLVSLSGSLVLALAVTRRRLTAGEAWTLSRIDEDWQITQWGADEDATETAARKQADFLEADRFFALCG
jgi:chaperone required for assembly of F1-ATPase